MSAYDTDLSVWLRLDQYVHSALFSGVSGLACFLWKPVHGREKDCESYLLIGA